MKVIRPVHHSDEHAVDVNQEFSRNVDELLKGAKAEECNVLSEAYRADLAFAERLIRARPRPQAAFEAGLKQRLLARMPRQEYKPRYAPRTGLVVGHWRLALSSLLVVLLVGGIVLGWVPEAAVLAARSLQDGVVRVLKHIGVREVPQSSIPSRARPPERVAEEYSAISKAQALVDFPIRVPGYLLHGFRLEGVQVLGPSAVALNYRRDPDGGRYRAELVGILQYRPKEESQTFFEVGEGTSEEIILNGKPAILVTGRGWARGVRWQRSEGYGVIWEEGDLVLSLWSTLSREETLRIAESVR